MRSFSCGVLALALLGTAPTVSLAAEPSRIEAIFDLSSPELGVAAYVDAFADNDYVAAFFLLDPQAHERFMVAMQRFQLGHFSGIDFDQIDRDDMAGLPTEYAEDIERPSISYNAMQMFAFYMALADREDAHLISFDGNVGLFGDALTIESTGTPFTEDGRQRAWVETTVQNEGPVRFLMQESPSGRWRVLSIVARPGADDEAVFLPPRE